MTYTKQTWKDLPSTETPISAERMNHIETGIESVDNAIGDLSSLDTTNKDSIVEAVNELAYDYIVERGTYDFWQWIKWASGKAECFGNKQYSHIVTNNQAGVQWYGNDIDVPLPNIFAHIDFALISIGQGSVSSGFFPYRYNVSDSTSKLTIRSYSNTTGNCAVAFHIFGTWK